ncbi:MAG: class I adenylate-forming enzyme family protein [Desulfobacterales bacterium]|nr:class I adenylate-forming enzyme family protein [Desulfobacterales bacterium]
MSKATRFTREMIDEYVKKGYWRSTSLCDYWDKCAQDYPDREAVVDSKTRLTWAQAKQWIDRLAVGFVQLGIEQDEVIVLQLPPMVENLLLRVACEKAGILCLPAARSFRHAEMTHIFNRVKPAGLVICRKFGGFDFFEMFEEIRPRIPGIRHIFMLADAVPEGTVSFASLLDGPGQQIPVNSLEERKFSAFETSLIVHTTGTTGMPKLVEQAMCSRLWQGFTYIDHFNMNKDDILGMFVPVASGPNGPVFFTAPQIGAKVVILEKWDVEEALKLIEKERISMGFLVPAMLISMVNHPNFDAYNISSLKLVWTGGALLPYHQGVEVEEKLGCLILQHYGAVDADVSTINSREDSREKRFLTVGKPMAGAEIKLMDEQGNEVPRGEVGEVWGRGPTSMPGYYGDEEATRQAWQGGWFKMGDLGKWEKDGNLALAGRKKDMIIRGGQNIYPAEIEDLLKTHPKVVEGAIVGMPDPVMGQKCCAYVVLKKGEELFLDELVSFLKDKKFALYKLPERLEIIERLPAVGDQQKVDKKALEQDIIQKLKKEIV